MVISPFLWDFEFNVPVKPPFSSTIFEEFFPFHLCSTNFFESFILILSLCRMFSSESVFFELSGPEAEPKKTTEERRADRQDNEFCESFNTLMQRENFFLDKNLNLVY